MPPLPPLFSAAWTSADLVNHLWQSTVVAAVLVALLRLFQTRLSARTRRRLTGLALAKFVIPAALFLPLFETAGVGEAWIESPAWRMIETPAQAASSVEMAAPRSSRHGSSASTVLMLWSCGFIATVSGWCWRAWRLRRRVLANATLLSPELKRHVAAAAQRGGFPLPPRCLAVSPTEGPGVLGALCPILVLPRGMEAALSPGECETILIHELVHLQRRDTLWGAVYLLLVCALWFHPLAWLLFRRWSIETEKSCDERVVEITGDAATYAGGIVKIVAIALGLPRLGLTGAATPPIASRVKAILAHPTCRRRPALQAAVLAAGVVIVALSTRAGTIAVASDNMMAVAPVPSADPRPTATPSAMPSTANAAPIPPPAPASLPVSTPEPEVSVTREASPPAAEPTPLLPPAPLAAFEVATPLTSAPTAIEVAPTPVAQPSPVPALPPVIAPAPAAISSTQIIADSSPADIRATIDILQSHEPSPKVAAPKVYKISQVEQIPIARFQAQPSYPFNLRRAGVTGQVVVSLVVNQRGDVQDARALRSSHPDFEDAAIKAVSRWKFRPGRIGGKAVNTLMQVPIVFSISTDR